MNEVKALSEIIKNTTKSPSMLEHRGTVTGISGGNVSVLLDGGDTATICTTKLVECAIGDRVMVTIDPNSRSAMVKGNLTSPSTDDTRAEEAYTKADAADTAASLASGAAERAEAAASRAEATANGVDAIARAAQASADAASEAVGEIEAYVGYAEGYTQTLAEKVDEAAGLASQAQSSADDAATAASEARERAGDALDAAGDAQASAVQAGASASGALAALSTVQDVLGALQWASENCDFVATADAEPVPGKWYFERSGGAYTPVDVAEGGDPSALGLFEITQVDETMREYLLAHLSVTSEGLWVQAPESSGSRVLLSAASGIQLYKDGALVASYGGSTVIGAAGGMRIVMEVVDGAGWMRFKDAAGTDVAYITADAMGNSTFYMTKSVVLKDLYFGNFKFFDRANGNMGFKYTGKGV